MQHGHEWNQTTNFEYTTYTHPNRTLLGSSLLHPLKQPRTCDTLNIPFLYCLCERESTRIDAPSTSIAIGRAVIEAMNDAIAESPVAKFCAILTLDETRTAGAQLLEITLENGMRILRALIYASPSGANYDAYATAVSFKSLSAKKSSKNISFF